VTDDAHDGSTYVVWVTVPTNGLQVRYHAGPLSLASRASATV